MEELKNAPVRPSEPEQVQRKPYEPPTAEVILLAPQEELSAFNFHQDDSSFRWGIGSWANFFGTAGQNGLGDPASGIVGTVNPDSWVPPTE